MIAIGAGTLALPRLALHRETVAALAGGRPDMPTKAENKTHGKGCNKTRDCTLFKCASIVGPC